MEKLEPFKCHVEPATLGHRWKRWLTSFELYADGKGHILTENASATTKQRRRALLLHLAGPDTQEIFATLSDTGDATDYAKAVEKLNAYFVPKVNSAFARQTFHKLNQDAGETVLQFVTKLRHAAKDCDFGEDKDNQIRDAVLSRCTSDYVRRKLLEDGQKLTLDRTLEIASQCEHVETQMSALSKTGDGQKVETVNRVVQKKQYTPRQGGGNKGQASKSTNRGSCYRCGKQDHYGRDPNCPARGKTCNKCKLKDHFAVMCKTKPGNKSGRSQVNQVTEEETETQHDYAFIVRDGNTHTSMIPVNIGGVGIDVLIDSGATCNIVDEETWEQLKKSKIDCKSTPINRKLYTYASESPLSVKGQFTCKTQVENKSIESQFIVVRGKGVPLLGKETAMKLGVLKIGVDVANITDHTKTPTGTGQRVT